MPRPGRSKIPAAATGTSLRRRRVARAEDFRGVDQVLHAHPRDESPKEAGDEVSLGDIGERRRILDPIRRDRGESEGAQRPPQGPAKTSALAEVAEVDRIAALLEGVIEQLVDQSQLCELVENGQAFARELGSDQLERQPPRSRHFEAEPAPLAAREGAQHFPPLAAGAGHHEATSRWRVSQCIRQPIQDRISWRDIVGWRGLAQGMSTGREARSSSGLRFHPPRGRAGRQGGRRVRLRSWRAPCRCRVRPPSSTWAWPFRRRLSATIVDDGR